MTITRKTLRPKNQGERGLWFYVDFDKNDCVVGFEEHDGYQGGPRTTPAGKTPLTHFAERAAARGATGEEISDFLFDAG